MKKIILSAAVIALGFAATSCKKSYTCECVDYSTSTPTTTFTTVKEKTQADAENSCYAMGNTTTKGCGLLNLH